MSRKDNFSYTIIYSNRLIVTNFLHLYVISSSTLPFLCYIIQRKTTELQWYVTRWQDSSSGRIAQWWSARPRTKKSAVQASTTASGCGGELFTYI